MRVLKDEAQVAAIYGQNSAQTTTLILEAAKQLGAVFAARSTQALPGATSEVVVRTAPGSPPRSTE